jgi:hypothetical protein
MKVKLKARGLWSTVETGSGDHQEDMMTLDVLSSAVPPEMVSAVASKDMAKAPWETIKMMQIGDDRVREAAAQHLLHQFETTEIKEEESRGLLNAPERHGPAFGHARGNRRGAGCQ